MKIVGHKINFTQDEKNAMLAKPDNQWVLKKEPENQNGLVVQLKFAENARRLWGLDLVPYVENDPRYNGPPRVDYTLGENLIEVKAKSKNAVSHTIGVKQVPRFPELLSLGSDISIICFTEVSRYTYVCEGCIAFSTLQAGNKVIYFDSFKDLGTKYFKSVAVKFKELSTLIG